MTGIDPLFLKDVARQLRYRDLPGLTGSSVLIKSADKVEADIKAALSHELQFETHLIGPEQKYISGAMAKYGLLDLTFSAPGSLQRGEYESGIHLLKRLGFLPEGEQAEALSELSHVLGEKEDDPTCLLELYEDISLDQTLLRLFLESDRIPGMGPHIPGKLPDDYLPRIFKVTDACVTNAEFVWFHKHFYL
jgi:hypothetical protein